MNRWGEHPDGVGQCGGHQSGNVAALGLWYQFLAGAQVATERRQYGVVAPTPEIAREQQDLANTFADLKLIPKTIEVKDAFLNLELGRA